jgi:aminoglycoside phosphotransferase (APT) family kinase protein
MEIPKPHADEINIDVLLIKRLLTSQFPQWADLPIRPVEFGGHDNKMFHLGEEMSIRLPSSAKYSKQVEKEHRWLPILAPLLPLPIPVPLAMGASEKYFPSHWSVYEWLDGKNAAVAQIEDMQQFAITLAQFLTALQRCDAAGGPPPGPHNFFRGGPLSTYDAEVRQALAALDGRIDMKAVTDMWETALASTWQNPPVWLHGDVSAGNLLVKAGRLSAVIDFGCSGVGDPACDLSIAWTFFNGESREAFRAAISTDNDTWARGRGWTLWKALLTLAKAYELDCPEEAGKSHRIIEALLTETAG